MNKSLAVLLLCLVPLPAFSKSIPADAWQSGTLKDSSESSHVRSGGVINGNEYGTHGVMASHEYPIVEYTIETETYIYQVNLVLRRDRDKRPALTIHGPIKFAIVKSDFFIQDEQGKQYKLVLARKTLKTNP